MRTSNLYIISAGVAVGAVSCIYFLSLLIHLPFWATNIIIVAVVALLYYWLLAGAKALNVAASQGKATMQWVSLIFLAVALIFISNSINTYALKYGAWDAMAIWNFHAEYLYDPEHWRKVFQNTAYSHADYPMCLPATVAYFMRVCSTDSTLMVPFVLCVALVLTIPVLVFQEVSQKQMGAAVGVLALFIVEDYYVVSSVSQYADIVVAFFLLCAFICASHIREDKRYAALCAFFIAACAWTKNEGIVLALIFVAWNARVFFSKQNIIYSIGGLALPLVTLAAFKLSCPAQNDLVAGASNDIIGYLWQPSRYATIAGSYKKVIMKEFPFTTIAIIIFAVFCIVKKKMPGKPFYILATCIVAYSMFYVLTPKPLVWHLETSHSRLLLQLMPALLYVMGSHIAGMPIALPRLAKAK